MLKYLIAFSCFLISLSGYGTPQGESKDVCEKSEDIFLRVDEEICEFHTEASKSCFANLNKELGNIMKIKQENKELVTKNQVKILRKKYKDGINITKNYLVRLKDIKCTNEKVKMKVFLSEMKKDLSYLSNRL